MSARMNRRLFGMMAKRLDEAEFGKVLDGRDDRGKRWCLEALLRSIIGAMLAGCRSLADAEALSTRMSGPIRRLLGIKRRVPDTTLRNALCSIEPDNLRPALHAEIKKAHRRKALDPDELPFGVASLDGKHLSIPGCDDWYAQRQTPDETASLVGVVRTVTATLTSSVARPILDVSSIPAPTNEMGIFERALAELSEAYKGLELFELVTYDAGACSAHNASFVRQRGLHYLFGLTAAQPTLFDDAKRWLGPRKDVDAVSEDFERGHKIVRKLFLGEVTVDLDGWEHLRTVVRVETETFDAAGKSVYREDRYLLSSLPRCRLTVQHWLLVLRRHWGVETSHQVVDTAFAEDDHPWIKANPRATLVVAILRRIAYTILTLFRSVTQRSDQLRRLPWKTLMADVLFAFFTTTEQQLAGLRYRLC